MQTFRGTATIEDTYVIEAVDIEQAREFILDMAEEDYPDADLVMVEAKDVEQIN